LAPVLVEASAPAEPVDLAAGSDLAFEDRGEHELKGVPGGWQLFAVTDGRTRDVLESAGRRRPDEELASTAIRDIPGEVADPA